MAKTDCLGLNQPDKEECTQQCRCLWRSLWPWNTPTSPFIHNLPTHTHIQGKRSGSKYSMPSREGTEVSSVEKIKQWHVDWYQYIATAGQSYTQKCVKVIFCVSLCSYKEQFAVLFLNDVSLYENRILSSCPLFTYQFSRMECPFIECTHQNTEMSVAPQFNTFIHFLHPSVLVVIAS